MTIRRMAVSGLADRASGKDLSVRSTDMWFMIQASHAGRKAENDPFAGSGSTGVACVQTGALAGFEPG